MCVTLVLRELAWDGGVFPLPALQPIAQFGRRGAVADGAYPMCRANDRYGDRHTAMVTLVCGASSADILDALHGALLTDEEVRRPRDWIRYDDPFGDWHEEPCMDRAEVADNAVRRTQQDGDPS